MAHNSIIRRIAGEYQAWQAYRRAYRELARLDSHDLNDIGVAPWEIRGYARAAADRVRRR